jgi:hypothetical protein
MSDSCTLAAYTIDTAMRAAMTPTMSLFLLLMGFLFFVVEFGMLENSSNSDKHLKNGNYLDSRTPN